MIDELQNVTEVCQKITKFSDLYQDILKEAPSVQNDLKAKYVAFLNARIADLEALSTTINGL